MTTSGRQAITIGIERALERNWSVKNWSHGAVTIVTRMNLCKIGVSESA
jgi:hypothetical protein